MGNEEGKLAKIPRKIYKKMRKIFQKKCPNKKNFRGDNVRKTFGEDNVRKIFGEDNVRNLFGEDNVRKIDRGG